MLLEHMIDISNIEIPINWRDELLVRPMDDGGMGSLYILPKGISENNRIFGAQVSEIQFEDEDRILVIVSLNIDSNGHLFELDIWKTDFSKLIRFPKL